MKKGDKKLGQNSSKLEFSDARQLVPAKQRGSWPKEC